MYCHRKSRFSGALALLLVLFLLSANLQTSPEEEASILAVSYSRDTNSSSQIGNERPRVLKHGWYHSETLGNVRFVVTSGWFVLLLVLSDISPGGTQELV